MDGKLSVKSGEGAGIMGADRPRITESPQNLISGGKMGAKPKSQSKGGR